MSWEEVRQITAKLPGSLAEDVDPRTRRAVLMAAYLFDTNAFVKAYHTEAGTDRVAELFAEPLSQFSISSLTEVEFHSVFVQRVRGGGVTVGELHELRRKLKGDIRSKRLIVQGTFRYHYRAAEQLIITHGPTKRLRTLDALQLAVALELAGGRASTILLSRISILPQVAALEGLSVINPIVT